MSTRGASILDQAATLAEPIRCRILHLLERQELTVSELRTALQLPQSTVSRHLRLLADAGWLGVRQQGTSHFYESSVESLDDGSRRLWLLLREHAADQAAFTEDLARLETVLQARRSRSQQFFASTSGEWDQLRDELFGRQFDLAALVGLLSPDTHIADLACGTGRVAAALAPFVARVIAVDSSSGMLAAAQARLAPFANVEVRDGTLERLPIEDGVLDAATLFLALHHTADPVRVLREARRVLKPAGRLLVVDMMPHDREEYQRQMGHVWLGFSEARIERDLKTAGLGAVRYRPLPLDPAVKGPMVFAATARRPAATDRESATGTRQVVAGGQPTESTHW